MLHSHLDTSAADLYSTVTLPKLPNRIPLPAFVQVGLRIPGWKGGGLDPEDTECGMISRQRVL